jgi:2-polyprenyl-3-methyl-5-hydroxy-6-metoxy-1,4-benzoquinol methylase
MTAQERRIDSEMLKSQQYNNSKNLSARIRIHQLYSSNKQDLWDWYFEQILEKTPKEAKVLEVGTGRGDMWKVNESRIPEAWDITLTDFSTGMIADNQAHLGALSKRMNYKEADVQDLPFANGQFDIIFANYMLYHVPNIPQAIKELHRVLKPNGILFAATNGNNHLAKLYKIVAKYDKINDWANYFAVSFNLQNGADYLGAAFEDVEMHQFENNLWVTDAQAIIDYIASAVSVDGINLLEQHEASLRAKLEAQIAEKGGIFIGKETGFFIACGAK